MNEQQKVELKLIHMEDAISKEVEWLWYPYIPYGKITNSRRRSGRRKNNSGIKVSGNP